MLEVQPQWLELSLIFFPALVLLLFLGPLALAAFAVQGEPTGQAILPARAGQGVTLMPSSA
jgi:hypothetical protein